MNRNVDQAIHSPEKNTIRELWAEIYKMYKEKSERDKQVPIILTLCGSSGGEINKFIEKGLVKTTEVNAIDQEDAGNIIAVENSPEAVLKLQDKYPGLKILEVDFSNIIHGDNPTSWPRGQDEQHSRAYIVNLDLNKSLQAKYVGGNIQFPILTWIQKLAQLHAKDPIIEWVLLFTMHGEIQWEINISKTVLNYLRENFEIEEDFKIEFKSKYGEEVLNDILENEEIDLREKDSEYQQSILMAFVPKRIAYLVNSQGWRIEVSHNLMYGGVEGHTHSPLKTAPGPYLSPVSGP